MVAATLPAFLTVNTCISCDQGPYSQHFNHCDTVHISSTAWLGPMCRNRGKRPLPVVWALHKGVSKKTSPKPLRRMCTGLFATSVKMILLGSSPLLAASCRIMGSPYGGKRSSHSTLSGTRFKMLHLQDANLEALHHWMERRQTIPYMGRCHRLGAHKQMHMQNARRCTLR